MERTKNWKPRPQPQFGGGFAGLKPQLARLLRRMAARAGIGVLTTERMKRLVEAH